MVSPRHISQLSSTKVIGVYSPILPIVIPPTTLASCKLLACVESQLLSKPQENPIKAKSPNEFSPTHFIEAFFSLLSLPYIKTFQAFSCHQAIVAVIRRRSRRLVPRSLSLSLLPPDYRPADTRTSSIALISWVNRKDLFIHSAFPSNFHHPSAYNCRCLRKESDIDYHVQVNTSLSLNRRVESFPYSAPHWLVCFKSEEKGESGYLKNSSRS